MITYNIDVLIGKDNTDHKPVIKCHDTGVNFRINLKTEHRASKWRTTEEPYTIPAGATAVIKVTKPDKHYVVQDGTCQGSGVFFEPHPQTFTAVGVASAEVNIFNKDGRRITSGTFYIDVTQECADDCAEDSQTYVSVMGEQIQAAIDAADRAEEAAKRAEEAGESGGGAVSPEAIQQSVDKYMAEHPINETDPTVPEWAKQPDKPSYTAKEVGAMPKDTPIPTVPSALPNPNKLHFTGAANATYDGSEEVTVNIPSGGGSDGGGIEKLMDITTTGLTMEFQIPIDTEEMANKLLNASELHLYLYVPRDAEDTETNTSGNVSVGVPVTESYRPSFAVFQGAIPNPTLDYMRLSTSIAKIFVDTFGGSMERNAIGMQYKYVVGAGASSSLYHATVDARGFKKDSYIFVNGTQNMAAGTRFVLGVRT